MRVQLITQYWWPHDGVPHRRWSWITEALVKNGHQVTVVTPVAGKERGWNGLRSILREFLSHRTVAAEIGPQGESIYRVPASKHSDSLVKRAFNQGMVAFNSLVMVLVIWRNASRGMRPHLIVGTVPALPTAIATWLASRITDTPYVVDLRDAWPQLLEEVSRWDEVRGKPTALRSTIFRRGIKVSTGLVKILMHRIYREADGIIVTAETLGESLLDGGMLEKSDLFILRNVYPTPLRPKTYYPASQSAKRSLKVLYAGKIGRAQDLTTVLEAVSLAAERGYSIALRVRGTGAGLQQARDLADRLGISVDFGETVARQALQEDFDWADTALVHLRNWPALHQAVPSKTFELMRQKIHITGVVAGETADLIRTLGAGHVVPPGDYHGLAELWAYLLENPDELVVGDRARRWVISTEKEELRLFPAYLERLVENARVERTM
ncbi:glycosyltransferase family 4 protein [Corynebacterium sp. ACRQP]|uniref:glycosyltransferase family 4 protein n=1 Tax=Corynebacterium sp. ACRQP TaxID=2918195 RepID=UPI001EF740F0|nr:glycosyltransferase family 4 protein [Corynebacterium sp. ACRQP]MCG7236972.1 glycosyltransferase family 4 protein [Corynebacterium sp. ACRQP]